MGPVRQMPQVETHTLVRRPRAAAELLGLRGQRVGPREGQLRRELLVPATMSYIVHDCLLVSFLSTFHSPEGLLLLPGFETILRIVVEAVVCLSSRHKARYTKRYSWRDLAVGGWFMPWYHDVIIISWPRSCLYQRVHLMFSRPCLRRYGRTRWGVKCEVHCRT